MLDILVRLSPLFILILVGAVASKPLKLEAKTVANLLIYTLTPVVVFMGIWNAPNLGETIYLSPLVFLLCCILALSFLLFSKAHFKKDERYFCAYAVGMCNSGFFGFPAAVIFLGKEAFSNAVILSLGFTLFENTVGYYLGASSKFSSRDAVIKLVKLPSLYGAIAAIILRATWGLPPEILIESLQIFKGAFSVLGMMVIGFALRDLSFIHLDIKIWSWTLIYKNIFWPAAVCGLVYALKILNLALDPLMIKNLLLMSALPLAANTVSLAYHFHLDARRYGALVLSSTLLSVASIPLVLKLGAMLFK